MTREEGEEGGDDEEEGEEQMTANGFTCNSHDISVVTSPVEVLHCIHYLLCVAEAHLSSRGRISGFSFLFILSQ